MIQLENKLYTSTEVASILGVSLRSVYRYLDEGSLNAEVKTATGRHRFTKKNILDFLYPDGEPEETDKYSTNTRKNTTKNVSNTSINSENTNSSNNSFNNNQSQSNTSNSYNPSVNNSNSVNSNNTEDDNDIDWLSKFRAAAEKFKQEDNFENDNSQISNSNISNVAEPERKQLHYYRSSLGGLKDIAQSIDKFAKETNIDYAFTLNAGLSLHKPIKPFSMLHAYVRPSDLSRLERLLSLSKSDDSSAQLCLITTDNSIIYSNRELKHGLNVVSKNQLKEDVEEYAIELRDDLYSIL